ncbi:MAG TPA: hypothetical protein VF765_09620 [Polyangiaceae bacterium]
MTTKPLALGGSTVRSWSARATPQGAEAYVAYFNGTLAPQLAELPGHRGALVLTRADAGTVRITVLTFWDSMEAVRGFAGPEPDRAVVEDEARRVLLSFDRAVQHHTIAVDTITDGNG